MEKECFRGFRGRWTWVYNSKRVFGKFKKEVWRRR